ncbi:MAG: pantetheine-phosphate adenylyltransferase [Armatimonadota bacterium]|nr:pantetheine-phosphate adenylyltransferase [Armatimonadota bacterium]
MSERRTAVCPGTFDPVTLGHMDVFERAAVLFDRVVALVAASPEKAALFSLAERAELLAVAVAHLDNVEVDTFEGLLVDYCRRVGAAAIVKGLRSIDDFQHEQQMAMMNRRMLPDVDTVLLVTSPHVQFISSSLVREIWALGGDVGEFVPRPVAEALQQRRRQSQQ